jgi:hypothetical protein
VLGSLERTGEGFESAGGLDANVPQIVRPHLSRRADGLRPRTLYSSQNGRWLA